MTKTATRSNAPAKPSTRNNVPQDVQVELPKKLASKLNDFAAVRQERISLSNTEDLLKNEIKSLSNDYPAGTKLILKVKGVVRGNIAWRKGRKVVDMDLLLEGFPEAYAACVTDGDDYAVLNA